MTCERVDPHEHPELVGVLPAYFSEWLAGRRRAAPPLSSWKAAQAPDAAFGTVSGMRWTPEQRAAQAAAVERRRAEREA